MKLICPSCHYSAEVPPEKIPPEGGNARCPKCREQFFVEGPVPAPPGQASRITCPKCGAEQEAAETCGLCGLVFAKYRRRVQEQEALQRVDDQPVDDQPIKREKRPSLSAGPDASASFVFGSGRGDTMRWLEGGFIQPEDLAAAFRIAGVHPGRRQWRNFLDALSLWLGSVFLGAAVIFFFAYNWRDLGRFSRFGIVEVLLAAAVLASWRLGVEKMSGKAALLVGALLVGALLALVGQTYQTGADPWELFATWALFVSPWVALARFAPLWLLWLALLNLSAGLYYHAFAGIFGFLFGTHTLWFALTALNTAALAAWEVAAGHGISWLKERWPQRIIATASAGYATLMAVWMIVDIHPEKSSPLHVVGYLAWLAGAYAVYRRRIRDLYVLALGVLSIIIVVSVLMGHGVLRHADAGTFLLIGIVVLAISAAGGWWLRDVAREVEG